MIINLGFSCTDTLLSKFIRRVMGSKDKSHCYISFYDPSMDIELVIHADWPGIVIVRKADYKLENHIAVEYQISDTKLDKSIKKMFKHLGKKFNWTDLLSWFCFLMLKKWLKRKLKNPLQDPKKFICVDFVLTVLNDCDIVSLPIGLMNPMDLYFWCETNYQKLGWKRLTSEEANLEWGTKY
jgi:hypothetical protein